MDTKRFKSNVKSLYKKYAGRKGSWGFGAYEGERDTSAERVSREKRGWLAQLAEDVKLHETERMRLRGVCQ